MDSGNGYKIRLLLSHLKKPYQWYGVDIDGGETKSKEYLKINANGKIPVIELDNGKRLAESNAILYYLAQNTTYFSDDTYEQGKIMEWLFFEQYEHEPYIAVSRYIMRHLPQGHERYEELPKLKEKGKRALKLMDRHLETQSYFVANRLTIADIALFAYTHVAEQGGFDLEPYANICAWIGKVQSQANHIDIKWQPNADMN